MKKKILGGIAILAIAAVAAFNVGFNSQSDDLSDVLLANVEALADGEVLIGAPCRIVNFYYCLYINPGLPFLALEGIPLGS
jgi:hypothetical protein